MAYYPELASYFWANFYYSMLMSLKGLILHNVKLFSRIYACSVFCDTCLRCMIIKPDVIINDVIKSHFTYI